MCKIIAASVMGSSVCSSIRIFLTRYLRIPIGERAIRVLLPCPDVELIERRDTIAVRGTDIVEHLTHQR